MLVRIMRYVLPKPMLRMNLAPAYGDPARLTDEHVNRYSRSDAGARYPATR